MDLVGIINKNVMKFLEIHNYKIISSKTQLDYIIIDCEKDKKKFTVIIITNSESVRKSPDMEKILSLIQEDGFIVAPEDISTSVANKFELIKKSKPNNYIAIHHYKRFIMNFKERPIQHTVMTKEEVKHLLEVDLLTTIGSLPYILLDDVQAIWADARVGDVIKIITPEKLSVTSIRYRRVIPH
jgi:DNA-directed RNA polymerase subunit H (RpoH/RPB5)